MKNKVKILVLATVLVLLVAALAACSGGGSTDTTTVPGTTATTTGGDDGTTAPGDGKQPVPVSFPAKKELTYTGGSLTNSMKIRNTFLNVEYVYKKNGVEVEAKDVVNVGEYEVTATFTFKKAEFADQYSLPAPLTETFTIVPATLKADTYKLSDKTVYWYPECAYDITYNGRVPAGLSFVYSIRQVKNAAGADIDITLDAGAKATAAGEYEVTLSFVDEGGNYVPASLVPQKATLKIVSCPNQVLKGTPTLDGVLDDAYLSSAHFATLAVENDPDAIAAAVKDADDHTIVLTKHAGDGSTSANKFGASAELYYLWDNDYVYLCVVVKDETKFPRSEDYVKQKNPWINDAIEFYYFFGGYEKPIPTSDTCPTYSAVMTDALGRGEKETTGGASISALTRQKSAFYDEIQCAATETSNGYIIEYAFPNKQEVLVDENGILDPETGVYHCKEPVIEDGVVKTIKAGEFGYAGFQLNDMTAAAEGTMPQEGKYMDDRSPSTITSAWSEYENLNAKYVYYANNRTKDAVDRFMVFQFSDTAAQ